MTTPAKRAAYEPASRLLQPTVYDPDMARPTTTVVGAVFVMLRALVGFAWLAGFAFAWPALVNDSESLLGDLELTDDVAHVALAVVLVGGSVFLLFDAALGVFILRGHNLARIIVMTISVLSISSAFASWWAQDQEIHIAGTLPAVAFDILLLLALSSRSAAAYARRNQRRPDAADS